MCIQVRLVFVYVFLRTLININFYNRTLGFTESKIHYHKRSFIIELYFLRDLKVASLVGLKILYSTKRIE